MLEYFIFYLIFIQISFVISPIPNWDLSAQSINLMTSDNPFPDGYIIYNKNGYGITVILKKYIKRINRVITIENYVSIIRDGETLGPKKVDFDDIDSHYRGNKLNCEILICPKGKFHPYDFINGRHIDPPSEFQDSGGWDLRCFDHITGYFYLFYLLNNGKNFFLDIPEI